MAKKDNVLRLPDESRGEEWCSVCGDDNLVAVVDGETNCHYCGNEILLCSWCFGVMKDNIKELGI